MTKLSIFTGALLKSARIKKGMTLAQLASVVNINQSNLSRYERGEINPPLCTIIEISFALDDNLDVLNKVVLFVKELNKQDKKDESQRISENK